MLPERLEADKKKTVTEEDSDRRRQKKTVTGKP
jgi:hypothetical protein